MSIKATDLKKSSIVSINGAPHGVVSIAVQSPSARGGSSIYKVRFRNAQTGQKVDQTFKGDDQLEEVDLFRREVQYLYKNGDDYTFMDLETYDQFDLKEAEIENAIPYMIEDMEGIIALISENRVLGIVMPDTMEMEITETDPSIKGASATARTKPATLVTGLIVQVPEYISQGEVIKIDTRNDSFVSRV
jgi:elongation factor P